MSKHKTSKKPAQQKPALKKGGARIQRALAVATLPGGPTASAPSAPAGFTAPKRLPPPSLKATEQQVRDANDVGHELADSSTYREDFGKRVPDADTLAQSLATARAWSDEVTRADAWQRYVHISRDLAWATALTQMKALQPDFALALKHDPDLGAKYGQTQAFFGVRSAAAKKGASTRKKKKTLPPPPPPPPPPGP